MEFLKKTIERQRNEINQLKEIASKSEKELMEI